MKETRDLLFYNENSIDFNFSPEEMDTHQMMCVNNDSQQDTSFLTATTCIFDFQKDIYDDQNLMSFDPFFPQQRDMALWIASVGNGAIDWSTKPQLTLSKKIPDVVNEKGEEITPADLQRHYADKHVAKLPDHSCDLYYLLFKHAKFEATTLRIPLSLLNDNGTGALGPFDEIRSLTDEEQRLLTLLKTISHYSWVTKHATKDCTGQLLDLCKEGLQLVESIQVNKTFNGVILHILVAYFGRRSTALRDEFQLHKLFLEQRLDIELEILAQHGGADAIDSEKLRKVKKLSELWEWFNAIPYNHHPSVSQIEFIASQIGEKVSFVKSWVANKRRTGAKKRSKKPAPSTQIRPALKVFLEKKPFVSRQVV
ncbi:YALI0C07458p [Yarrowia lipolytica CLIB122]|uniref:Mating-type protein ALPHA2 n=1 Tax=Yarrowia lipolytica (strain CLIB 122 / E 150) TaxID=284591 RepID=MTAL2_YARLI|nr:YALI0C07458p [Yarrowia lipolytica CLIB122]Q707Y0.1 RecName: Full=Mating-type protein ALPHA2; AltName: Full=MATB2 transcription factor [Yarrowia lipolytica CLIB122]CAE84425.1 MATB2 transcription factor [Yarrowia lipolytica]CAG81859.1 YALI0C07458p [Yarrowia lipolytica CLIB122]|eukprot:XP_501556.1 YALI0C07458p [Yarrowia lipolytica CLIB122]